MFSILTKALTPTKIKKIKLRVIMTNECDYKGNSMREIYRDTNPWELLHLPPIVNRFNHTVLFQLPIDPSSTAPPEPHRSNSKWDSNHVRLPCAPQNEYSVFNEENRNEPEKKQRWEIIQTALLKPIRSSKELEKAILSYNTKYAKKWKFYALHELFNGLDESEVNIFFDETLPEIIRLALQLPDIVPSSIPLLKQGTNKSISLSQKQVACLLANAFLCTFPRRNESNSQAEYHNYPTINFNSLFQLRNPGESVLEKIKCICYYFRSVCKKMPTGVITFARRHWPERKYPDWSKCDIRFEESMMVHISADGTIEDDGQGLLQVDFANKFLGGGVLNYGCVQEEIRFVICPELFCSRLFTEQLEQNECLTVMGCERFNSYQGYANSFQWTGAYEDKTPMDIFKRRKTTIVAIDAIRFRDKAQQFEENMIKRELNKAFVGFYHELDTPAPGVSTGNWGCGAFNGDKTLKSLIQLMVCCVTNRPLVYFTFGDSKLRDDFYSIFQYLKQNKVKISELWSYLNQFRKHKSAAGHLYEFIIQCHKDRQAKDKPSSQSQTSTNIQSPIDSSTDLTQNGDVPLFSGVNEDIFDDEEIFKQLDDAESSNNLKRRKSSENIANIPKPKENVEKLTPIQPATQISESLAPIITKSNDNPEKRQRSLLESLDEYYHKESPSKIKRESESSTKRFSYSKPNTIVTFLDNSMQESKKNENNENSDGNSSPKSMDPESADLNTENDNLPEEPDENDANSESIEEMDNGLESLHVVSQASKENNVGSDDVIPATSPPTKTHKSQKSMFDYFKKN